MTDMNPTELRAVAKQFGELIATIYGQMYETLQKYDDIPEEKLEALTLQCFSTLLRAITDVVSSKVGTNHPVAGQADEIIDKLMAQVLSARGN